MCLVKISATQTNGLQAAIGTAILQEYKVASIVNWSGYISTKCSQGIWQQSLQISYEAMASRYAAKQSKDI